MNLRWRLVNFGRLAQDERFFLEPPTQFAKQILNMSIYVYPFTCRASQFLIYPSGIYNSQCPQFSGDDQTEWTDGSLLSLDMLWTCLHFGLSSSKAVIFLSGVSFTAKVSGMNGWNLLPSLSPCLVLWVSWLIFYMHLISSAFASLIYFCIYKPRC